MTGDILKSKNTVIAPQVSKQIMALLKIILYIDNLRTKPTKYEKHFQNQFYLYLLISQYTIAITLSIISWNLN